MYGTQTMIEFDGMSRPFENDVELYGTQTSKMNISFSSKFENDVELYGTQTDFFAGVAF